MAFEADDLFYLLPIGEQDERRHASDAVRLCELLVGVDIDFRDGRAGLCGQRLDDRFEHLARATPIGVEVREDDVVLVDDIVEMVRSVDV